MGLVDTLLESFPPLPKWEKPQKNQIPEHVVSQPKISGSYDIALGEHWLVLGMTGTGKTTFTKSLIERLHSMYHVPIYILDTKQWGDFDDYEHISESDKVPPLIKEGIQVWKPGIDDFEVYNRWFQKILEAKVPCIVYVDELSAITQGQTNVIAPEFYDRLMKQGRAFGITMIMGVQELSKIPRNAKKQTTHVIRFRLNPAAEYDIRLGHKLVGLPSWYPEPKARYGFFYKRIDQLGDTKEFTTYQQLLGV